ncbi:MAG TPA: 5-formyltetrahydrofolate cyclo-ligase [Lichenihabitans sp.]|nr:5-formyltetrahydrofolate cyclo-ligase [Lichenihabitans sp.]
MTKAELRNAALKQRDAIGDEGRALFAARLASVGPRLIRELSAGGERLVTSFYSAIGSEPDPMAMALALHAADVPLALPVDWSHGARLVYRRWVPGNRLASGPLGIVEPLPDAPELDPDVLFVPLVAFDRRGHRIGYGAGNLDRTLGALRARRTIRVIGIAYAVQEERFIPSEPHDEPVDLVVTERDILRIQA